MLHIYKKTCEVYWRGLYIKTFNKYFITDESKIDRLKYVIQVTWSNLEDIFEKYGSENLPFYYQRKFNKQDNGRKLMLYKPNLFNKRTWAIKQWKTETPDVRIEIDIDIADTKQISMNDFLKDFSLNVGIPYLVERGLFIVNK